MANAVVTGAFAANNIAGALGLSPSFSVWGPFNIALWGPAGPNGAWAGSVQLEKTYDGGVTWIVAGIGGSGQQAVWATGTDVSVVAGEIEKGCSYRLHATALTEGPLNYRMSTTGQAAISLAVGTAV